MRGSWKTDIDPSAASSSKSATHKSSLASTALRHIPIPLEKHTNDPAKNTHVVSPQSYSTHLLFRPRPRPKRSRTDFEATLSSYDYYISEDDYSTGASSSSSDTEEMVVTSLGGREKITLRASEADDTQDDNFIRFHGRNSTAGLVETTRQFKHMHMRETLSPTQLESTCPISPDNKTLAQTRRPEFWLAPHVGLFYYFCCIFLIFCLSGKSSMRVLVPILMKFLKRSFNTFLRQILLKLLLTSISGIQISYFLCYIVQPSLDNGSNGYIIVISGLHVSVH